MRRIWSEEIKTNAKKLRIKGYSYSQLTKEFGVAKSTLSGWFKDIPKPDNLYFSNRKDWMKLIRKKSSATIRRRRKREINKIIDKAKEEVGSWDNLQSKSVQKAMLSILYWAEGQKLPVMGAPVKFVNTDPRLMLLFITLLRSCYKIDEEKLRIRLHLHWYHNVKEAKRYWSELLQIDSSKIGKIYFKPRSKSRRFRKNFAGICFVVYHSVDLRWEIVQTGYNIQEKLTKKLDYTRS